MNFCSCMAKSILCAVIVLGLLLGGNAGAEDRTIYKHVDEKGSVVYSQTPPMSGASVKQLSPEPAYRGRGGYYGMSASAYGDARSYMDFYRQDQYRQAAQQRQQQINNANNNRLAELEAE